MIAAAAFCKSPAQLPWVSPAACNASNPLPCWMTNCVERLRGAPLEDIAVFLLPEGIEAVLSCRWLRSALLKHKQKLIFPDISDDNADEGG